MVHASATQQLSSIFIPDSAMCNPLIELPTAALHRDSPQIARSRNYRTQSIDHAQDRDEDQCKTGRRDRKGTSSPFRRAPTEAIRIVQSGRACAKAASSDGSGPFDLESQPAGSKPRTRQTAKPSARPRLDKLCRTTSTRLHPRAGRKPYRRLQSAKPTFAAKKVHHQKDFARSCLANNAPGRLPTAIPTTPATAIKRNTISE